MHLPWKSHEPIALWIYRGVSQVDRIILEVEGVNQLPRALARGNWTNNDDGL